MSKFVCPKKDCDRPGCSNHKQHEHDSECDEADRQGGCPACIEVAECPPPVNGGFVPCRQIEGEMYEVHDYKDIKPPNFNPCNLCDIAEGSMRCAKADCDNTYLTLIDPMQAPSLPKSKSDPSLIYSDLKLGGKTYKKMQHTSFAGCCALCDLKTVYRNQGPACFKYCTDKTYFKLEE